MHMVRGIVPNGRGTKAARLTKRLAPPGPRFLRTSAVLQQVTVTSLASR